MKKTTFFLVAFAALALVSCNKEADGSLPCNAGAEAQLCVNLLSTKATVADTENEAKIKTLQVFVFNGDNIDVYGSSTGSSVTVSATQGDRDIYALVNAPASLSSITTKSALLAAESTLSQDNAADGFVMVGSKSVTLAASNTVEINVDRIAARIKIDKVTRAFTADGLKALEASDVKIIRFYLTDVADNQNYAKSASVTSWLSSSLNDPASILTSSSLVYDKLSSAAAIAQDASYSTPHSLYAYPNPTSVDGSSAKITRLVVELQINGSFYTYPILIAGIQSNRSYEIKELRITRPGNPSDGDDLIEEGEDDPIAGSSATFNIVVNDWEQVFITSSGAEEGTVVI